MICTTMVAGEPFRIAFFAKTNGVSDSIAGFSRKIQLRAGVEGGKLIQEWGETSPQMTWDNAGGSVTLTLPPAITEAYTFKTAFLDLLLVNEARGRRSAPINVKLQRGVTRDESV